ncbi:PhoH family protein [Pirellula staleyi DSM 6068]|uniref:PhoH family protein n=1 Tax=Pirellula staleyi (strain ATCC 27377 / DSM 6068 / ICPB 4128) TaxID=530564 RepID=D2R0J2_PIRSD|nr:PhoH family protein [Pirellula staleyi]ADB14860.1 PhoH family protein [Pirellula staleyi DSM 6068]
MISSEVGNKLFVLDTNVILHDSGCINNFEEHDIAIPITVLEELDKFKRGNEDINFQAREFLRKVDAVTSEALSAEGASLGPNMGAMHVVLGGELDRRLKESFFQDCPDHRILNTALMLQKQQPNRSVILITKDTNLRMKAKSLGLPAEDYTTDKIESFDKLYTGKRVIEDAPPDLISRFYAEGGFVPQELASCIPSPIANENFILRSGSKSVLATYRAAEKCFVRVEKSTNYGISPRNAEQSFALKALTNDDIKLVTLAGTAGTGKTLLALAAALESRQRYRQILLARPVVPLGNRDLGFLPGDIDAKLDPYMQPLYDNLTVIRHQFNDNDAAAQRINEMRESEKLQITPLAYIRGRSLQRIFFIIDEAQNLTPHEVKTIITRAGEGTKIVLTGDIRQIDQPYLDALSNGLSYLIHRMVGQPIFAHITLEKGERSALADLASELL